MKDSNLQVVPQWQPEVTGRRRDLIKAAGIAFGISIAVGFVCAALLINDRLFSRVDEEARFHIGIGLLFLVPALAWLWFGVIRPFRIGATIHLARTPTWKTGDRTYLVWRARDPDRFLCVCVGHLLATAAALAFGLMLLILGLHELEKAQPAPNPPAAEDAGVTAPCLRSACICVSSPGEDSC